MLHRILSILGAAFLLFAFTGIAYVAFLGAQLYWGSGERLMSVIMHGAVVLLLVIGVIGARDTLASAPRRRR